MKKLMKVVLLVAIGAGCGSNEPATGANASDQGSGIYEDVASPGGAEADTDAAAPEVGECRACEVSDVLYGDASDTTPDVGAETEECGTPEECPEPSECPEPTKCPEPEQCPTCEQCPEPEVCPEPPPPVVIKTCPAQTETILCTAEGGAQLPTPGNELVPGSRCLVGLVAKDADAPRAARLKFTAGGITPGCGAGDKAYGEWIFPTRRATPIEGEANFAWAEWWTSLPAGWEYNAKWKREGTHVAFEEVENYKHTYEVTKPTVAAPPYPISDAYLDEGGCVHGGAFNAWLWAWPNAVAPHIDDDCPVVSQVTIDADNVEAYDAEGNQLKVEYLRTSEGAFLVTSELDW